MKFSRCCVLVVVVFAVACGETASPNEASVARAVATPNDPYEQNDNCFDATYLSLPAAPSAELTTGDVDYFALDLHAGETLVAGLTAPLRIGIYDPNAGDWIGRSYGFVSVTVPADGRYCVAVGCQSDSELDGGGDGCEEPYMLFPSVQTMAADAFEPNDSQAAAVPVALPTTLTGLSIYPSGDADWFEVNVAADQLLQVTVQPGAIFVPTTVSIYDATGALLASDPMSAQLVAPAAGTYRVSVRSFDPTATGTYDLIVASPTVGPDRFEPNNTAAEATPAPGSGALTGLTLDPAGDIDVYRVSVPPSSVLRITALAGNFTPLRVRVTDAAGTPLAEATNIVTVAPDAGDVYVTINAQLPGAVGEYSLNLSTTVIGADAYEPNNTAALATPIAVTATVDASLPDGDVDTYRVELPAGSELRVTATATFSSVQASIFDPSNPEPQSSRPDIYALHSGTYYIDVRSEPGGMRDLYRLSLSYVPPPVVLEAGHPFEILAARNGGPYGALGTDRETGFVYAVDSTDGPITRFGADGTSQSWRPANDNPFMHAPWLALDVRRGFGGSDVFMIDSAGQIVASNALSSPGTVLAAPGATFGAGLAFSDRALFISSGLAGTAGSWIQTMDKSGALSPFMGASALSSEPSALAFSPDRRTLYYSNPSGQIVWVDVATASEGRAVLAGMLDGGPPKVAVDGATGAVYALVGGGPDPVSVVRYQASSNSFVPFMVDLTDAADLAFGPCAAPDGERCLYVSSIRGIFKIHGFQRVFDIADATGDAPPALDVVGVTLTYANLEGGASSTHLVATLQLAAPPATGAKYSLSIDFGEGATPSADVIPWVSFASGAPVWSGIQDLAQRSTVSGNQIRFAVPISRLRNLATDPQKAAAAERILVWVNTTSASGSDRAPDSGVVEMRSFYPVLTMLPQLVDFEGVPVGQVGSMRTRIANTGIGPLTLSANVTGSGFALSVPPPTTIAEGAVVEAEVTCSPNRAGILEGSLRARAQAPVGAKQARLLCAGYTLPATIAFTDPAGDFEHIGPRTVDLLSVDVRREVDEVVFRATFDRRVAIADSVIPRPPGATLVNGFFEFDYDSNRSTGECFGCGYGATYEIGAEKTIGFFSARNGFFLIDRGVSGHVTASGNSLIFEFPPEVFERGCFDFVMAVGAASGPDLSQFDVIGDGAPNAGAYRVTVGCTDSAKH